MNLLILFWSFLFVSTLYSQNISGIVVDLDNQPVEMAIVQLKEGDNVVSYLTTDESGRFYFNHLKNISYLIEITNWSFETKTQEISAEEQNKEIKIVLQEKVNELKEVEVQARAVLAYRKGDTLSYNLKAIADGRERKLKDLVGKLPGVQIDPVSGKISANGKVIDDLLINGQKLFGNNHQLATENINAEMLEEISLINNYETFSPLKDISTSEKTAMNIKIKQEFLGKMTGEVDLFSAYQSRYKINPKAFNFNKKYSLSVIAKLDNTGEEAMNMSDFMTLNSGIKNDIRSESLSETTSAKQVPSYLLSDKNVFKKHFQFLSVYSVFQPKEHWSINSYFIGNHSLSQESFLSSKVFYNYPLKIEDLQKNKIRNFHFLSKINSEYTTPTALINYTFSFSKNKIQKESEIENMWNHHTFNYTEKSIPNGFNIGQQLSFIKKITRFSLLSFNGYHQYQKNDDLLDILSNTNLFNTNNTHFYQKIEEKNQELGFFAKYSLKLNQNNIFNAVSGYHYLFQRVHYQNTGQITNDLSRHFLWNKVSFIHKKTKFEYGISAELRHYLKEKKTFLIPEAVAKYHFKRDLHTAEIKYQKEIKLPSVLQANPLSYAKDFRHFYLNSGLNLHQQMLQNHYQFNYLFLDFYRGIHLFAFSKYTQNEQMITYDNDFLNHVNYIENQLAEDGFKWINYFNLGIQLFKIKQKIEIKGGYHLIKTPFYINHHLSETFFKQKSLELNWSSHFKESSFGYTLGFKNSMTTSLTNQSKISGVEWIPKIDFNIKLNQNITAYFSHNYHISTSEAFKNRFWELNYKIDYHKDASKWRYYMIAENFLNLSGNKILNSAEKQTYFETQQIERLLGFIGVGATFEF